ncbi:C-type lectin domain family 2 member D6-like isoform X3 [Crotalus tigris]|uniref:C-type lectin domain family 2 member D6-like isoform X3 n=1 Tax=Crotalus tigris TaxID=88082 RepID=UPI00192FB3E0|nr:C-type lectin domain family 2 member D6-like isoform X3 [Crotalus tigris]
MNLPLDLQTELPLLVPREAPPPNEAPRPPRTGQAAPPLELWTPPKIFGGLLRPCLACVRGTEGDPREAPAAMFKTPKVSPGEEISGRPRGTPKLGASREFSLDSDPSELRSRGPLQQSSSKKVQAEGGPSRPPHVPQNGTSWPCSAIGLLSICVILLLLVTLMNLKVAMLEKRTKEEADLWQWKMLTLTEILKDLQIGKVRNCSVCKVQWMQLSSNCYFFRNRQLSWHSSQTFCQEENADLTMVTNMEEMIRNIGR